MAGFPYAYRAMDSGRRFVELVTAPGEPPLDLACALMAACADHRVDVANVLQQLDQLAASCPDHSLEGLVRHLFGPDGYRGNKQDYYDADNSLLDKVLARRVGIPITLSVLLMETGRRIGVPLVGIGAPGHFLVRHGVDANVFIDAFNGGLIFDRSAARRLVETLQPGVWSEQALEPVSNRAILLRMLANLKAVYLHRSDAVALAWVLELRAALPGTPESERQELANARAQFN
ncbi:MAG: hypothetical protein JWL70_19 [Acidimicrobiia bacterium]|nr:hypothetical protein [Acidimicrobiia bacterium]